MASREILSLDTATPQIVAPQTGDTYSAPRAVAISPESLTGSAATTSLNIAQTWNTTGTPTAVKLNVTDTASNAASLLMDLQVGGTSKFSVAKSGSITFAGHRMYSDANAICFTNSSNVTTLISRTDFTLVPQAAFIGWGNFASFASDLSLFRDAANTLAQRSATNAQTFRVYNTFTDASNYERGKIAWESNLLVIGTEAAGSGTSRRIRLSSGNGEIAFGAGTNDEFGVIGSVFRVTASNAINWSSLDNNVNSGFDDLGLSRSAAGILVLTNGSTGGGSLELREQTAPAAPAANNVRIYAEDNGSGKTRLMALFNTGAAQQIAIEP